MEGISLASLSFGLILSTSSDPARASGCAREALCEVAASLDASKSHSACAGDASVLVFASPKPPRFSAASSSARSPEDAPQPIEGADCEAPGRFDRDQLSDVCKLLVLNKGVALRAWGGWSRGVSEESRRRCRTWNLNGESTYHSTKQIRR